MALATVDALESLHATLVRYQGAVNALGFAVPGSQSWRGLVVEDEHDGSARGG